MPVTASLASIPSRAKALPDVLGSLLPQVDKIRIWLNGWDHTPKCVVHRKIVVMGRSDVGDAGKFGGIEKGYNLTCDDDLIYMSGYVKLMCDAADRVGIVTLQGRLMHRELDSYYSDRAGQTKYCLGDNVPIDVRVHIGGTGVMAFHTDLIQFSLDDFPYRNMADVQVALKCAREGIPIYVARHTGKEVRLHKKVDHMKDSIWARSRHNDQVPTAIANRVFQLNRKVAA